MTGVLKEEFNVWAVVTQRKPLVRDKILKYFVKRIPRNLIFSWNQDGFYLIVVIKYTYDEFCADQSGRAVLTGMNCLRSLEHWDRVF
jgi:phage-related protein